MTLVVFSVLGMSVVTVTMNSLKASSVERSDQSAYYIAESGITLITNEVRENIMSLYNAASSETEFFDSFEDKFGIGLEKTYDSFEESFGEKPVAKMIIEKVDANTPTRQYKIKSTGTIGKLSRTVEKSMEITWVPKRSNVSIPNGKAVFVKNTIHLENNASVDGDVGTYSSLQEAIILENNAILKGTVEANSTNPIKSENNAKFIGSVGPMTTEVNFKMPKWEFPSFTSTITDFNLSNNENKTLEMNTNLSYDDFIISNNGVLNINVTGKSKNLVVNNLEINNNATMNISGGKLTIFVLNKLDISNGSQINKLENRKNLKIIVKGSEISVGNNSKLYGSLCVENAEIDISNNVEFLGHIITGGTKVTIGGNSVVTPRLLYAPNAEVVLSNNSDFNGSIIANSFKGGNNSKLKFMPWDSESLPLPTEDGTGGSDSIDDIVSFGANRESN